MNCRSTASPTEMAASSGERGGEGGDVWFMHETCGTDGRKEGGEKGGVKAL